MIICILPTGEWAALNSSNLPAFLSIPDEKAELLYELSESTLRELACGAKTFNEVIEESRFS